MKKKDSWGHIEKDDLFLAHLNSDYKPVEKNFRKTVINQLRIISKQAKSKNKTQIISFEICPVPIIGEPNEKHWSTILQIHEAILNELVGIGVVERYEFVKKHSQASELIPPELITYVRISFFPRQIINVYEKSSAGVISEKKSLQKRNKPEIDIYFNDEQIWRDVAKGKPYKPEDNSQRGRVLFYLLGSTDFNKKEHIRINANIATERKVGRAIEGINEQAIKKLKLKKGEDNNLIIAEKSRGYRKNPIYKFIKR